MTTGSATQDVHRRQTIPRASKGTRAVAGLSIAIIGVLWFAWSLATDDDPVANGSQFERIDAWVADLRNDARIPGVSLAIVEDGVVVHGAGFGEDGRGVPVTADTPFWIGSNTKSMTALATMQLVESGIVDLDSSVRSYVPDFSVADERASVEITVRSLLNQTSGISRHDGLRAVVEADADRSLHDVVAGMADLELNRPVGERFEYANLNSVVLGAVIEAVTGETWQEYVQANIFEPLEMANTYTDRAAAEANGLTATHRSFFGFPIEANTPHHQGLAPTGYVYSSANDMARYLAMYLEGGLLEGIRVLSEAGVDEMLSSATNERTFPLQGEQFTASYGAGWFVGSFGEADDARWHQGSLPSYAAWLVVLPETEQAVVVMVNAGNQFDIGGANSAWSRLPQGVVNLLRDAEPPTGVSAARFFIVFATLVALAVIAQVLTLATVLRRARPLPDSTMRRVAPLLWELIAAPLLLMAYPAVTGGFGWAAAISFIPDLSLGVLAVAGLAVCTGLARAVWLIQARSRPTTEFVPPPSTIRPDTARTDSGRVSTTVNQ